MKAKNICLFIILLALMAKFSVHAQENDEAMKIETIIKLTRFIDMPHNESFNQSKRILYIITDMRQKINYEMGNPNSFHYNNWHIVHSDRMLDFDNGSVVYVTKNREKYINHLISISTEKDILTIADNNDRFCQNGGMINLKDENGKIKFEINYRIIQDKSIDISSKLLALSKIYQ